MAAAKNKKGASGGAQNHIRARLSYLHRASAYLFLQQPLKTKGSAGKSECENTTSETAQKSCRESDEQGQSQKQATRVCLPRHYINQMRGVSLKAQQRLSTETKRGFCKRCDLLLISGVTCTEEIRNASKGRKKPWADVLVTRCLACETEKRVPQNKQRSKKLKHRKNEEKDANDQTGVS